MWRPGATKAATVEREQRRRKEERMIVIMIFVADQRFMPVSFDSDVAAHVVVAAQKKDRRLREV